MENDYELVSLAQENNENARQIIYSKYKPIIIKKSQTAFFYAPHHGIEINDIMQEGYLGLEDAIKHFSQDDTASFYTFANLCIDRTINNYIKKTITTRNKILDNALLIDDCLENIISDTNNIEDDFIYKIKENDFLDMVKKKLTIFELNVFELKINGYSFEEIANTLNKDIKSIYNTYHRIKEKIKKIKIIDD